MLIRSERQAALNEIIEHCLKMADHYQVAATLVKDPDLAELFASIGRKRNELAAGLAPHLRRLGDLPAAPDRDRETVEDLATRLKAAWVEDERLELLTERQHGEEELSRLVAAALRQELPEEAAAYLRAARNEIAATCQQLAAVRSDLGSSGGEES